MSQILLRYCLSITILTSFPISAMDNTKDTQAQDNDTTYLAYAVNAANVTNNIYPNRPEMVIAGAVVVGTGYIADRISDYFKSFK